MNQTQLPWYKGLKIAVYTCITGSYDQLTTPPATNTDIDYIAFLPLENITQSEGDVWSLRPINDDLIQAHSNYYDTWDERDRQVKTARFYKINHHLALPEYDITIWVDGNMEVIESFVKTNPFAIYNDFDFLLTKHPIRNCAYKEAAVCMAERKDHNKLRINHQLGKYIERYFPSNERLFETGFMIRRNTTDMADLMQAWWQEVDQNSYRDQISLPFILWSGENPNVKLVTITSTERNHYVTLSRHTNKTLENLPKLHQFRSWDHTGRKDLGRAYNEDWLTFYNAVHDQRSVDIDEWILFMDNDILPLNNHWYRSLQLSAKKHSDAGIITCYASRSANPLQCKSKEGMQVGVNGYYGSEDPNILHHIQIANDMDILTEDGKCTDITKQAKQHKISGFCMLTRLSVLEAVGGFAEGSALGIDNDFADRVLEAAYRIYRNEQVYLFHLYRLDKGQSYKDHLV